VEYTNPAIQSTWTKRARRCPAARALRKQARRLVLLWMTLYVSPTPLFPPLPLSPYIHTSVYWREYTSTSRQKTNKQRQVNDARAKKNRLDERIPELTQEGINKAEGIRKDARQKINEGVDKVDRTVEEKTAEAKGTVSGWFGGGKK
jgi:hypothetical protein